MRGRFAGLLVSASILAAVAGCGGGETVDVSMIETNLKAEFESLKKVTLSELSCPKDQPIKVSAKIECKGTTTDGKEYAFDVEVKDASGKLAWQSTGLNP
jgi:hypothetical protein